MALIGCSTTETTEVVVFDKNIVGRIGEVTGTDGIVR
jgi:hypothetical protein